MKTNCVSQKGRIQCLAVYVVALPLLLCLGASTRVHTQTLTTLVSFNGTNGAFPSYQLTPSQMVRIHRWVQHPNGNFYGTAPYGGANNKGTVFQVTSSGALTVLYSFCSIGGSACTDGSTPQASLIAGSDGSLYGSTFYGGASGDGTVFKITTSGALTTLFSFSGSNGANPLGALVQAGNGNLFGTTFAGGANNDGTVFEITCGGSLTTLHSFSGSDGVNPEGNLLLSNGNGNLYGATLAGGNSTGAGTLFEISTSGAFTSLYDFCSRTNCTDGSSPQEPFTQDAWGNIYGTTTYSGANTGGTVFQLTTWNGLHTLYHFCSKTNASGVCTDGEYPVAGLDLGNDGNLYGTTYQGGTNNEGTAFVITPWTVLYTLYNFCSLANCADGANPESSLVQGTDGTFYGTTAFGGSSNMGTAFKLSTMPTAGNQCNGVYSGQYWGNLTASSGQSCTWTDGAQIFGNVYLTGGALNLNNATVFGNVQIQGGTYTLGPSLSIWSNLQIQNLASSSVQGSVCGVNLNGNLEIDGNAAPIQIGSSAGSCPGNTIGGHLELENNTSLVQGFNNTILDVLTCDGNTSVTGGGNTARQKIDQCSSF